MRAQTVEWNAGRSLLGGSVSAILAGAVCVMDAQALGPMRTGMLEVGARSWKVGRTSRDSAGVDQFLVGASAARFFNDNVSLGVEFATFAGGVPSDSLVIDLRARLYWTPLARLSPWTELRGGGALGLPQGNALRLGGAFGFRWVPGCCADHLALDLQLVGFERWRQDWAAEYVEEDKPSGRIEWSMTRSPWSSARSGLLGHASPLSWPVMGVSWLF